MEKRIERLERVVFALIKRLDNEKKYQSATTQGIGQTEGEHGEIIRATVDDVADTRTALEEIYEMIIGDN